MGQASAADLSLRPVIRLHFDFLIPYGLVCLDHGNLRPIRSNYLLWPSEAIGCRHASLRRRRRAKRCCWTDRMQVLCQPSPQPGARPPGGIASRPGEPAARSARSADKDPPGRWCRHVVIAADRCRHVGTAEGVGPPDLQGKTTYNGTTGAGLTPHCQSRNLVAIENRAFRRHPLTLLSAHSGGEDHLLLATSRPSPPQVAELLVAPEHPSPTTDADVRCDNRPRRISACVSSAAR